MNNNRTLGAWAVMSLIAVLMLVSFSSQLSTVYKPFFTRQNDIRNLLALDDFSRHCAVLGNIGEAIKAIRAMPEDTVLYFAPVFSDTPGVQENTFWWWHLHHILRYFCYPRKILVLHFDLYGNNREEFMRRYVKTAESLGETEWARQRGVSYVILYRGNRIFIAPAQLPVEQLNL